MNSNDNNKKNLWFVICTSFGREAEVKRLLEKNKIKYFLFSNSVSVNNSISKVIPSYPGLLFVYAYKDEIIEFVKEHSFVSFKVTRNGDRFVAATILDITMQQLIDEGKIKDGCISLSNGDNISIR